MEKIRQYWPAPIPPLHIASGTALANSTTLTDISPTPAKKLGANALEHGCILQIRASGKFSTTGTPTLLIGCYWGGVAGVALAAMAATTTGSNAAAWPWILEYEGWVRSPGAAGSIFGSGCVHLGTSLTAMSNIAIPATEALRTVTIDTSVEKALTVGAQWSAASASNTITCDTFNAVLVS